MTIASVCRECGECFPDGGEHKCRPERVEGIAAAVKAGCDHCGKPHITIMIVDAQMQAVAEGKVLFETPILRLDGHDIFAAFLKAWVEAGIVEDCAC